MLVRDHWMLASACVIVRAFACKCCLPECYSVAPPRGSNGNSPTCATCVQPRTCVSECGPPV
eukprot:13545317-Alexandrium_andersonii.AAC.1